MNTPHLTRLCLLTFVSAGVLACESKRDGASTRAHPERTLATARVDAQTAATLGVDDTSAVTMSLAETGVEVDSAATVATSSASSGPHNQQTNRANTSSTSRSSPAPETRTPVRPLASSSVAAGGSSSTTPTAHTVRSAIQQGEGFRVYLQGASPLLVGETRRFTVVVEALAPFKSNDKYPYRFTGLTGKGITLAQDKVTAARVTPERTALDVEVTGASASDATLEGVLSFSVCTEEKCLIERASLSVNFAVVGRP